MKKILLTIDTEFIISQTEILGINGTNGIEEILDILEEYDVKVTFFIDYYEQKKWGDEIFEKITSLISKAGHEIELHLHPGIFGGNGYLWQYNKEEQNKLITEAINIYKKFNGKNPEFFRAGGYSANDETLDILEENNFLADLSFQYKQKRCKISSSLFPYVNKFSYVNNLLEIPTTVYKYNFIKEQYSSINFEWSSLNELKEISRQINNSGLDYFVIMMHSFSFLKRWDRKRFTKNNRQKKKFRKFLEFAKDNGFEFVTVNDFYNSVKANNIKGNEDFIPTVKNPIIIFNGVVEKIRNKFVLNKKFRLKFLTGFIFSMFLSLLVLYLILFNSFSPGYKEANNVSIDITSWNKDKNISTIENYFIELGNYKTKTQKYKDKNGILFRKPFTDTKKYITKPGIDTLYIATDMSGNIIMDYSKFTETKDSTYYYEILRFGNWLKKNVVIKNNFAVWPYHFKFTKYDLDYDWCGAWALGNILSAISRLIVLTGDSTYIALANKTVNTFETKIEDGGILFTDEKNNYWFEEYPALPPNHVLNGHINGLFGLYDYWRITKNKKAETLFDKGVKTVLDNLEKYDTGYWSYYDLQYPYVADYYYHKNVHIPQLKVLYQLTGNKIFKQYAEKWKGYFHEPYYSLFKLKMIYDGLHRRFTYKSFFTLGK